MPRHNDGAAVWRLVHEQRSLDLNAGYAYLLLCTRFTSTCRVARAASNTGPAQDRPSDGLAAALMGVLLPDKPDTYFVWQIAVHERFRGRGLGRAMIQDVLRQRTAAKIRYVEAHVSPSNSAKAACLMDAGSSHGVFCGNQYS